jgi:hypothetical protein
VLWAPEAGKRFIVTDLLVVASGTTDATTSIFEDTDAPGNRLFKAPIEVVTNKQFQLNHAFKTPFKANAVDSVLKVSTSDDLEIDISVHGYEI